MPGRNQVPLNVRVSPTKKDEWKTAIDNDETLAGVVRLAVDRELNDEYVHVDAAEHLDGGDDIDFSEVTTDIDSLSGQVEVMQNQLDNALTPGTMPTEDMLSELAMQVLAHIPRYDDLPDHVKRKIGETDTDPLNGIKTAIEGRETRVDGSAQAIAFKLDADILNNLSTRSSKYTSSSRQTMYRSTNHSQ